MLSKLLFCSLKVAAILHPPPFSLVTWGEEVKWASLTSPIFMTDEPIIHLAKY